MTLAEIATAIRCRQSERANDGLPPMEEMFLPASAYDQISEEAKGICTFGKAAFRIEEMLCCGVKIMRMDDA